MKVIEKFEDDMIYAKTKALNASGTIDNIVKTLKSPTKEEHDMLKDYFTKKDLHNMMFLDTTKGLFETSKMSEKLIDDFSPTVIEKNERA